MNIYIAIGLILLYVIPGFLTVLFWRKSLKYAGTPTPIIKSLGRSIIRLSFVPVFNIVLMKASYHDFMAIKRYVQERNKRIKEVADTLRKIARDDKEVNNILKEIADDMEKDLIK